MSDHHPAYAPPPDYSPSPAPAHYGPEAFGVPSQGQPDDRVAPGPSGNKKPVMIIIGIVVAVLALCCCLGAAGLALFAVDSGTTTTIPGLPDVSP